MKVTKYPQSCLLLEKEGSRIIIDPGAFVEGGGFAADSFGDVDGILITHEHQDHADVGLIQRLKGDRDIPVVGNESTKKYLGKDVVTNVVTDHEELSVGDFRVTAHELAHCDMPDGSPGPQNTGYIIDGVLFHPGDGTWTEGVTVKTVAAPVAGPDVSPRDAFDLAKSVGAKLLIPIHYDYFKEDPHILAEWAHMLQMPFEIKPLKNGESLEI
jgi:L-ascorbate metabolism protein UlaG (beta-lactamase superfamily)